MCKLRTVTDADAKTTQYLYVIKGTQPFTKLCHGMCKLRTVTDANAKTTHYLYEHFSNQARAARGDATQHWVDNGQGKCFMQLIRCAQQRWRR